MTAWTVCPAPPLAFFLPLPHPPAGTPLWWYVGATCVAVVIIGIAKAGFGGGIGILAVPLIATTLPPSRTIGVMLPILITADVFSNYHHFGKQSTSHLLWLLTGAVLGIAAGSGLLIWLQDTGDLEVVLNLVVGFICLALVAVQCFRLAGGALPHIPRGPWSGRVTGGVAGVASTLAHSAGPIASVYLLEQQLDKSRFVGTMVTFFFIVNLLKLPTYFGLHLITKGTLIESLWFIPLVPVGALVGVWMHRRIPEKPFTVVVYLGAAAAAANMIYKGFRG